MALKDDKKGLLTTNLGNISNNITNTLTGISTHLQDSLNNIDNNLGLVNHDILNLLDEQVEFTGFDLLEGIQDSLQQGFQNTFLSINPIIDLLTVQTGNMDVLGTVLEPLMDILKEWSLWLGKKGSNELLKLFAPLQILKTIVSRIDNQIKPTRDFTEYLKMFNEFSNTVIGIKPFNPLLTGKSFTDTDKKGVYYTVMRAITFGILGVLISVQGLFKFFSPLLEQKLVEFYKYSKLSLPDYISLNRRELLSDDSLESKAEFLGFDKSALNHAKIITEFYPTARDLIDFAVREAFEPDENLFIHNANAIPKPFINFGKTVGLTQEWIKRFWHSHWRLLSVGQVFDAFHRGFMTEAASLDYLRRLDYVENDRETLLNMSFNLLTRVDVRRLFENGIITDQELKDYYTTLGFSDTDVNNLSTLAKQLRFIETKDLRNLYIEQFREGLLTDEQIKQLLLDTGLTTDEVNLFIQFSEASRDLEFKKELKDKIITAYYNDDIDFETLVKQLRGLGISNKELSRIRDNAILVSFKKKRLPTLAELKRWLRKEIITVETFVDYMERLGFDIDIIIYNLVDLGIIK